ncbi:MAG TPA: spermine synthase [Armatimonadota bacterium]
MPIVLSHYQAKPLLEAWSRGASQAATSVDLNRSEVEAALEPAGVRYTGGELLGWDDLRRVTEEASVCFGLTDAGLVKVQEYSESASHLVSLMPTPRAPTMLLSGIPMHRIKGIDPWEDTQRKIRAVAPVVGKVLDTTMGLGYSALQAAESGGEVTTIEVDPTVVRIARRNPWSAPLFTHPRVTMLEGSSLDLAPELPTGAFSRILHDPPTFSLAGELYSGAFYRELYRVLSRSGRLFHYIGDLESISGRVVAKGATRRLLEAGFEKVQRRPEAFALVAYKGGP